MGRIKVQLTATRVGGRAPVERKALVDTGADATTLGIADACVLGLDVARAKIARMGTAGGGVLEGYYLSRVALEANGRRATLSIFVPVAQVITVKGKRHAKLIDQDEEPLLGHDFLQRSNSVLDFETDTLKGVSTVKSHGPFKRLKVSAADQRRIRAMASCPMPRKK